MFKKALFTLMLFFIIPATAAYANAVRDEMLEPVVKINDNCSAVAIETYKLLTAAHCVPVNAPGYFNIDKYDGTDLLTSEKIYYKIIRVDKIHDLALLEILDKSTPRLKPAILAKEAPEEGDDVWSVGYPMAQTRVISKGLFNEPQIGKFGGQTLVKRYRSTAMIMGGNSGGPLYSFENGHYRVIGINVQMWLFNGQIPITHMVVSATLEDIKAFIKD